MVLRCCGHLDMAGISMLLASSAAEALLPLCFCMALAPAAATATAGPLAKADRVYALDLIGFGRSDQPGLCRQPLTTALGSATGRVS